ncbi:hypothetical protein, partial [Klebsiella pneumoniae]|uniref:hypothetical protein n=1 Tax=Klebsiella pneumoniae TaxID=573 RepID=UPI00197A9C20
YAQLPLQVDLKSFKINVRSLHRPDLAEHEFLLSSSVEVANNILYESQCGVCQRSQAGNQAEHGITLGTKLINPAIATLG